MGMLGSLASLAMHQRTVGRAMCCLARLPFALPRCRWKTRLRWGKIPLVSWGFFPWWSWGIVEERRLQLQWWESPTFPAQGHRDLLWISCLEFSGFAVCLPFIYWIYCAQPDLWCSPIFFVSLSFLVQRFCSSQYLGSGWNATRYNSRASSSRFLAHSCSKCTFLGDTRATQRGVPQQKPGCVFCFNAVFCVNFFSSPLFLSWRIKVIYVHRTSFFLIGSMIIPGFFGCCFLWNWGWYGSTDDTEYTVGDFSKNGKAIFPGDLKGVTEMQWSKRIRRWTFFGFEVS